MAEDKTYENEIIISSNNRGSNDLEYKLDESQRKIEALHKELDFKNEECQALYLEIKNQHKIDQAHKKLNGELRLQITSLEQKIVDMEKHEKEMLNYP
jgi:DNA-dependent RNA polymerase auxiliary subunit epsilon